MAEQPRKRPNGLPPAMVQVVAELSRLPGVGDKSASRMALSLLARPREEVLALAEALLEMKERVSLCQQCYGLSEGPRCVVCQNSLREHSLLCVVEGPADLLAIERTRSYNGLYHVLHGALSPLDGVGPDHLRLNELVARLTAPAAAVREVIVATGATVAGEATALYVAGLLKPLGVKTTRLARGLPAGADLDYSDAATLVSALAGRRDL